MQRIEKLALFLTKGIGPRRFKRIVDNLQEWNYKEATKFVPESLSHVLKKLDVSKAEEELRRAYRMGMDIVVYGEKDYPHELANIPYPPPVLYIKGNKDLLSSRKFAIVGTRKPTKYGMENAFNFARKLVEYGFTIVSGGAIGIDTYAHKGALENTIVVLGSGLDVLHPRSNIPLFRKILERGGLIISQFPLGTKPLRENFPVRNMTIAGLSLGVLMVEGDEDSGALITSRYAFEFDREVFTIPNRIGIPQSRGPIKLLKQSIAKVVETPEDIVEELGYSLREGGKSKTSVLPKEERVLSLIEGRVHLDEIMNAYKEDDLFEILLSLEMKGIIRKLPGNYYERRA